MSGLGEDLPRTAAAVLRRALPVWGALVLLLAATVVLAYLPLGRFALAASLGIAAAKALLVALFFMQLRRPDPLLRLASGASLLWIAFMLALILGDTLMRAADRPAKISWPGASTAISAALPVTGGS